MEMKTSGDSTHAPYATPPEKFRAIATGVGQTQRASAMTGGMRAERVAQTIKNPGCVPACEGYPRFEHEPKGMS
jgi:hypothetical protein